MSVGPKVVESFCDSMFICWMCEGLHEPCALQAVYGSSCQMGDQASLLHNLFQMKIDRTLEDGLEGADGMLEDVGGIEAWQSLLIKLEDKLEDD